jgi:hypothetical protein
MATKKKCMSCGGSMKMKTGGITQDIVGMPGYNARTDTMKKGGIATMMNPKNYSSGGSSTAVKERCPPGTARLANGGCGNRPLYGG